MHEGWHFLYTLKIFPSWSERHQPESGSLSKHTKQEKAKSNMKNLVPKKIQLSADALDTNETSSKIAHLCVWGYYSWMQRQQRKCHISITFPELEISSLLLRQYIGGQKPQSWICKPFFRQLEQQTHVPSIHLQQDNRNNQKNETTDHRHHIWKVPSNQCTYRSNKYSESETNSSTQNFQCQLASKTLSPGSIARDWRQS
jgi:hypothetical protein